MSLCRWSSDDWQSDVYVYGSHAGWVTHVAARRYVFNEPLPPPVELAEGFSDAEFNTWSARQARVREMLDRAELAPIGGPYDGESFTDPDDQTCANRLRALRDAGYHVPDGVIEELVTT